MLTADDAQADALSRPANIHVIERRLSRSFTALVIIMGLVINFLRGFMNALHRGFVRIRQDLDCSYAMPIIKETIPICKVMA